MRRSNYDKSPIVAVPDSQGTSVVGWDRIAERLRGAVASRHADRTVLCVDCYPGVNQAHMLRELARRMPTALAVEASQAMLPPQAIDDLAAPYLGGDDPVFGRLCELGLPEWFDPQKVESLRRRIAEVRDGVVLVVGCGATHIAAPDVLAYADLARRQICERMKRHQIGNLGAANPSEPFGLQYKRAYFVDWRVADRWKKPLLDACDFFLDANDERSPKLAAGEAFRRGLRHVTTRPFRVTPFFDPAPWGGQWMRSVCELDADSPNYGWCFDCVPEENSLSLRLGDVDMELPSLDLVLCEPQRLLGERVYGRFGAEFPIRFDFLDTVGGGNLSLQVHPLTAYMREHFGLSYTQDESYYLLDAQPDSTVYLGLRADADRRAFEQELRAAHHGGPAFDAERYVQRWPAKKHDHFSIPAGVCHCSGANSMVLEISATPYIFTFKMWDWGRPGLDGRPRPIHLEHGLANIGWNWTAPRVQQELINRIRPLSAGPAWREEATGLHESQFIETRRHWFWRPTPHDTMGTVNVMNLVEGNEALITSPDGLFEPFLVHFAETWIVPADVGKFTITPCGSPLGEKCATLKAFVRGEDCDTTARG
ncbi:MAG: mannose-6-phosphate isomerase [Planctomycetota bacterium]|nr:MAG: mannose-6-phosphate isomerase [Planctomycetota bacterium]